MHKKLLFLAFALFFIPKSYGQLNVSYHQSNLPFIAVGYDINERFTPEFRLGTDQFISDLSLEAVLNYKFIRKEDYDFYAGLGYRINISEGLVAPVGLNFYPFNKKKFGFHIEAAPILLDADILRGSFGIRYRFLKN
ncbi:hypothetical protein [Salegentibacter maritimus]|uniref:hypothetical protein n=1 Tax=Salegentibacter maritimus TaxID=2794347 RepID=UPI0018E3FECF|nr:hypothetical protein [Salegentibacter maritimus]MBI6116340.1 hypothetical protein [Salegentibacter maritimus]